MGIIKSIRKEITRLRDANRNVSDREIIQYALDAEGILTVGALKMRTELKSWQAQNRLQKLAMQGVFKVVYEKNGSSWFYRLKRPELYKDLGPVKSRPAQPDPEEEDKLSDAAVISHAVALQGRITPATLCVKAQVSLEAATEKLKLLQQKDVFDIVLNDKGTIVYILNDFETFQEMMR
ncbi:MAG: hypothetical protein AAFR61_18330 [Bacteroidota bacterium]